MSAGIRIENVRQELRVQKPEKGVFPLLQVGDKVKFAGERLRYTVRAAGARFAVCNKPFNPRRTVLYCIVDFERGIRGPENLMFGFGAETDEQCREMLERVEAGETEISHRRMAPLKIESITRVSRRD